MEETLYVLVYTVIVRPYRNLTFFYSWHKLLESLQLFKRLKVLYKFTVNVEGSNVENGFS